MFFRWVRIMSSLSPGDRSPLVVFCFRTTLALVLDKYCAQMSEKESVRKELIFLSQDNGHGKVGKPYNR